MAGALVRRHTVHVIDRGGEGGRRREGGTSHNDTMRVISVSLWSSSSSTHRGRGWR